MTSQIFLNSRRAFSSDATPNFFNVIISGGGLIGQTMACALAKNPLFKNTNILLIESSPKKDYASKENNYSNRVSSIAPTTKEFFEKLGMWKNIKRYQVMKDMKVWGYLSKDFINFEHDIDNPAYIVENDEIVNAAMIENSKASNVKILYGSAIKGVTLNTGKRSRNHQITLVDGSLYDTNLLIGADGANSLIRNVMQSDYINWNYNQFGIVATMHLSDNNENNTAWQRFLPDGPIAILPLSKGISSLVWSVTESKAKKIIKLPEEVFVEALNEALHSEPQKNEIATVVNNCSKSFLGLFGPKTFPQPLIPPHIKSVVPKSIAAFPLSFGHCSQYYKNGVVLIGDSAHKVHPLAGQGVNIGFRDIQNLEDKLSQGLFNGRVLGNAMDLKHYETVAQRQNVPLMAAIDALHWIYTSNNTIVKAFGNVCFQFTESVRPVKAVMKQLAT
ncbi:ubiquinone biosynthesis monooxygenase COQ6, mitochondrial [Halyomorpha halys]|uniref:ubiquinone biosynthesis monooxygenase COQ6, mitochondrial n=1 Tax=Halyomorpha halys TaxID=286706 RepID=UPI0006D507B6|nr:ubiquinone biosynthesis monooxygenase COQ6, mitochondrial [Halyomorpha halys]